MTAVPNRALLTLLSLLVIWPTLTLAADPLPVTRASMNESVVMIPADATGVVNLETTLFSPEGPGPFPLVVFNHGRDAGDPHAQPRSRPLAFAREFVRRGYLVAVPNRRGFAQSTGVYPDTGCDLEADGVAQARDIAATVDALSRDPRVDASRIVIAGVSHGGFASLAYAMHPAAGVRGIINFSGGLRKDQCPRWRDALIQAFGDFGAQTRIPALWFYGTNDRTFDPDLIASVRRAYADGGAQATLIDYGIYKDDAHGLVGDRDAVSVWWPATARYLQLIGLPTRIASRVSEARDARPRPQASGFAKIDAVDAVPFLDDAGRIGYLTFLSQPAPRAFALSRSGRWSWAQGGDDPLSEAIDNCSQKSSTPCKAYAIDDFVVWRSK